MPAVSTVMISYARLDIDRCNELTGILREAKQHLGVDAWVDRKIPIGASWFGEIVTAIESADAFVLIVTEAFLASPFILREELPRIVERASDEGVRVCIAVPATCAWRDVAALQSIVRWGGASIFEEEGALRSAADHLVARRAWRNSAASARYLRRLPPLANSSPLLARNRTVPLVGRARELAELRAWFGDDAPVSVLALVGGAGVGKSRLALALCDVLESSAWDVGLLRDEALEGAELPSWRPERDTLAVVDYSARHAPALEAWLNALKGRRDPHRLRVLLVERHASPEIGWWSRLLSAMSVPATLLPLEPIARTEDRRAIWDCAVRLAPASTQPPVLPEALRFERELDTASWAGDPLFLIIAATIAARHGQATRVVSLKSAALVEQVALRHLELYEQELGREDRGDVRRFTLHLLGCVGLHRRLRTDQLADLVVRERANWLASARAEARALPVPSTVIKLDVTAIDRLPVAHFTKAVEGLCEGSTGWVSLPGPEIVSEALVVHLLARELAPRSVVRAAERASDVVIATVLRALQDLGDHPFEDGVSPPAVWFDAIFDEARRSQKTWTVALAQQMPRRSVVLLERAVDVARQLVTQSRPGRERRQLSSALSELAVRLTDVGRADEARVALEEARDLFGQASGGDGGESDAILATLEHNLGVALHGQGEIEASLKATQRALALRRRLARNHPARHEPELASSLRNIATAYLLLGKYEEGLPRAEEAVTLYGRLVAQGDERLEPELAVAMNNRGNLFWKLGRWKDAVASMEEAIAIRRRLAIQSPDEYEPDLANSLGNLSTLYASVKDFERGLAVAVEATDTLEGLNDRHRGAFESRLAQHLMNLGVAFLHLNRYADARAPLERSAAIRRTLSGVKAQADLSDTLMNLGETLRRTGDDAAALAATQESVTILRTMGAALAEAAEPKLARSLGSLAATQMKMGSVDAAEATLKEAFLLLAPHRARNPRSHQALHRQLWFVRLMIIGSRGFRLAVVVAVGLLIRWLLRRL